MRNRLLTHLNRSRRKGEKLFCAYLTLGYPNLLSTASVIMALEQAGTDIVELGFPFSDPLADGPTIQHASEQSIGRGVRIEDSFRVMKSLRKKGLKIPVLFFSYLNPIVHYGVRRMAVQLRASGFDGAIIPDLPPEEGSVVEGAFKQKGLSLVYLAAPTTGRGRMKAIGKRSSGFVYYVSLRGVTGARHDIPRDLMRNLKVLKRMTKKPVLVGFGVSEPAQARAIARVADGIVVGSAIVDRLRRTKGSVHAVKSFVSQLVAAMSKGA